MHLDDLQNGSGPELRQSLRVFTLYRVFVPAFLLFSMLSNFAPEVLGRLHPTLFSLIATAYLAATLAQALGAHRGLGISPFRIGAIALTDIVAITLFTFASGGGASGLGMLLVPAIAGIGLLSPGRTAVFYAATGTVALLGLEVWGTVTNTFRETGFTQTGLIGASLFAMAGLAWVLSHRVYETEVIAEQRGTDLANMERLNAHIIERLGSGVIVVAEDGRIRLINHAAWRLFDRSGITDASTLDGLSPKLAEVHRTWLTGGSGGRVTVEAEGALPEMQARFTRLGIERPAGTLIFVEDTRDFHRQIQEVKLASLGRLTASIAHEIRNPLGAISHAAQLLEESEALDGQGRRLTGIVRDQSNRINTLVKSILGLSRRQAPRRERIELGPWLDRFATEFRQQNNLDADKLGWTVAPAGIVVHFDPDHLHQIVWNLCTNALRHGHDSAGMAHIEIIAGTDIVPPLVTLDVIDRGKGIEPRLLREVFEPFVTGTHEGIGLGLYIARELCENNAGQLTYLPVPTGGSCFRIQFPSVDERETE